MSKYTISASPPKPGDDRAQLLLMRDNGDGTFSIASEINWTPVSPDIWYGPEHSFLFASPAERDEFIAAFRRVSIVDINSRTQASGDLVERLRARAKSWENHEVIGEQALLNEAADALSLKGQKIDSEIAGTGGLK